LAAGSVPAAVLAHVARRPRRSAGRVCSAPGGV